MKLLNLLAKLGIVRMGVKTGTYHSGTDRPTEFLMDDVLDAKRDLTTAKDVERVRQMATGGRDAARR